MSHELRHWLWLEGKKFILNCLFLCNDDLTNPFSDLGGSLAPTVSPCLAPRPGTLTQVFCVLGFWAGEGGGGLDYNYGAETWLESIIFSVFCLGLKIIFFCCRNTLLRLLWSFSSYNSTPKKGKLNWVNSYLNFNVLRDLGMAVASYGHIVKSLAR